MAAPSVLGRDEDVSRPSLQDGFICVPLVTHSNPHITSGTSPPQAMEEKTAGDVVPLDHVTADAIHRDSGRL
jgi:hypothetical protein